MSSSSDTLRFHFPTYGDSVLSKMNALREEQCFCDITLLLGGPQGPAIHPLHFHGHRVVLAASSDFLRDQFLLHKGRTELSLGVFSSMEVGKRLLLSCYTGLLEVPLKELVTYLTAASALQMSQVVEKCAQAISQYLSPTLASLKLEKHSEDTEIQLPESVWPGASSKSQEEKATVQPNSSILEVGATEIESKPKVKVDRDGKREVQDERGVVISKTESFEDAACCLTSEASGEIQPAHTNKLYSQKFTGALRCKLNPPPATKDHTSSATNQVSSAEPEQLVGCSQKQDEEAEEEQRENKDMLLLAAQLQECGELLDYRLFSVSGAHLPKAHCSEDEQTEDSDSVLGQRPYLCRRCDRVFQHLESYMGHLKEHRQYLCLFCEKGFSQKTNLARHIRIHTGVKPFRCPLCHKTFSQKATLQDHFNLHTGDKPHKCNYCAVHFAHKPGLRRHLKDIHGKSSFQNVLEEAVVW